MAERRVVVTGATFPDDILDQLVKAGLSVDVVRGDLSEAAVADALRGAWGYVLGGSERMTRGVWQALPDLRAVCFLGTGYASFMELPLTHTQIAFSYTPYANAVAVAEFAVTLMLDMTRGVSERAASVARGGWSEVATPSLIGARVGIAGLGHVGREAARILTEGFGAEIHYWNRTQHPEFDSLGYERADNLVSLCEQVNVLSLHVGYQPGDNDGMISWDELRALGPNGLLVNTARAELVDADALRESVESGAIRGAAFDGYYEEPTPSPQEDARGLLRLYPKVLVTPHCAYLSEQAMHRMAEMAAENLLAVASGAGVPYAISPTGQ